MALKILVTGGAGYVGTVLVPMLLERDYDVTVFDNLMYEQCVLLECFSSSKFHFLRKDIRDAQAVQKDPTRSLKLKNSNYDPHEVASKDGFLTAYTGKFYDSASSTEVISMGLQHLYEDAAEFAEKSPDHFNFMVAALRGLI